MKSKRNRTPRNVAALPSHIRHRFLLAATVALSGGAALLAPSVVHAQAPPSVDFQWNNFISSGSQWVNANNWIPGGPPISSIDRVLGFGSSSLQTVTGYTTTNSSGNFNVNSLVFTSNSNASGGVNVTNTLATDSVVFNTSSLSLLPSIWQMGTGRATFRHAVLGSSGITLAGGATGTTLQIRGSGVGDTYLDTSIAQTGAGASGIQINQTGARPFFTGATVRLGGSASTFTGGVDLAAGNLMLSNVLGTTGAFNPTISVAATPVNSLGTGPLTINGGSLQFDPTAVSSGASPTGATGTLQVNNAVVLNSTLNLTGVAPATAPSSNIIGIFAGNISGNGGINIATTNGTLVYGITGNNTFTGPVNITPIGNTVSTLLVGTANVASGNLSGTTSLTVTGNSSLTLNNVFGVAPRLNTVTAPSLTLNRGNFNLLGNPTANVSETVGVLTVNGMGSLTILSGSGTAQSATLTAGSLNRGADGKGTLSITAQNMGSGTGAGEGILAITATPGDQMGGGGGAGTADRTILPYAVANSQNISAGISATLTNAGTTVNTTNTAAGSTLNLGLLRYDTVTGKLVPLNLTTEYATNLYTTGIAAPNANMRLASSSGAPIASSAAGINSSTTVNSLILDTNTVATASNGVSIGGSGTLKLGGGAILVGSNGNAGTGTITIPSIINLGGLDFGSASGYFHTNSSLIVNAPITGSGGVVKSLAGTLFLNGNNTFTGGLALNSSTVQFNTDANLGAAGQPITFNSGLTTGLNYLPSNLFASSGTGTETVNRPIAVGAGGGVLSVGLTNTNLTLPGTLSGTGQFFKSGAGILTLSGTNTITGNIAGNAGILAVQNDAALGGAASSVVLAGATFQPLTSFATSHNFLQTASSFVFTNGLDFTLNGLLLTQQQPSANQTFFKVGTGKLVLTAANTFNQQFQLGESTPTVRASAPAGAQPAGTLELSGPNGGINQAASVFSIGGGELILDNSTDPNSNRLPNATLSLVGGNVTLKGNAGTPINETIGALSIANANNQYGGILTIDSPIGAGATTLTSTAAYATQAAPNVGTLFVRATNLGAGAGDRGALVMPTTPTQTNGLIPSILTAASATAADPTGFATVATITNAAPNVNQFSIVPFTAYTPGGALGAGAAANTYDVTSATTFGPGASAANAIRIGAGGGLNLGTGTLTVGAGSILTTGGANTGISNGTLNYAAGVTARFSVASGSDLTVSVPITGNIVASTTFSGGLNKLGGGTLTLNSPVTMPSTTVGTTTSSGQIGISAGSLKLGAAGVLPVGAQPFINFGANLDLNSINTTLGGLAGWGDTKLGTGNLTISSATTPLLSYAGGLVGSGALIKSNTNTQILTGNSTGFSGDVRVLGGNLTVNSTGALGTGTTPILLGDTSGTTQATMLLGPAVNALNRDITIQAGSSPTTLHSLQTSAGIYTVSSNIAINNTAGTSTSGGFTGTGLGLRLNGSSGITGGENTQTGTISGAGGLLIFAGNWVFKGTNTYSGGTMVDTTTATVLGVGNNSAFGTGPLNFTTGFGANLRADGGARTLANDIRLSSTGGYFGVTGTNDLTLNGNFDLLGAAGAQTLNIHSAGKTTINGVIQNGTGGLVKNGVGTLNVTNANTYTGNTVINAGTLLVNNTSGNGLTATTVNAGAILGGTGSIGGNLTVNAGGIVSPGNSPGALTVNGNATFGLGSLITMEINGTTPGAGFDQLLVNGTVDLGSSSLMLSLGFTPTLSDKFFLVVNDGVDTISNTFLSLPDGSNVQFNGYQGTISYQGNSLTGDTFGGNDAVLFGLVQVPEPGTIALFALGGLPVLAGIRRRRALK